MNDEAFARHLSAWLDPYELSHAATRYDRDRDAALAPASLLISSGRITRGDEANFATMVAQYLRGLRLPPSLIDLVRRSARSSSASPEAWNWLRDLSLSSAVHSYCHGNGPPGTPPTVILRIEERDVVTDIIRRPVLALLDLASMLAMTWREVPALGASIYHQHNMPDPFYAHVDSQVASAYVNLFDLGLLAAGAPTFRYRAITVAGISDDDRLWEIAQELARHAAATTFEPIAKKD